MADNVLAGINYEINLGGNIEKKLDLIEARVKKLSAKASTVGSSKQTQAESSRAAAQKKFVDNLKQQLTFLNRIARQSKQEIDRLQAKIGLAKEEAKVRRQGVVIASDELRARQAAARATLADNKQLNKQLTLKERIARAESRTARGVAQELGVPLNRLIQESQVLAEQEAHREQNLRIQKEQAAVQRRRANELRVARDKQAKSAKLIRDDQAKIAAFAKQHNISLAKAADQMGVSVGRARDLGIEMSKIDSLATNFLFTFRRLVGVLAIFTLARKFAQFIEAGVREMIRFNAELESSRIAFGSLIASVGTIVDENGNVVTGAKALNAALEISDDLMVKLRKSALSTTATFEELLTAFQFAVGPGLAAGLNLDEVEQVAVNIAKAAGALKIPTNQLGEEIRSLVNGTITLRNTRLSVIGVTNQQIRLAKEEGRLFKLLSEKLQAFADASEVVANTFAGLQSRIKDAVSSLLAQGAEEYFNTLKAAMQEFLDALVDSEKISKNNFGFSDVALLGIQEFSAGMAGLIQDFMELSDASEVLDDIASVIGSIGSLMQIIGSVLVPVVLGIGRAFGFVSRIITAQVKQIERILKIGKGGVFAIKEILAFLSQIVGLVVIWKTVSLIQLRVYNGIKATLLSITIIKKAIVLVNAANLASVLATGRVLTAWKATLVFIRVLFSGVYAVAVGLAIFILIILQRMGLLTELMSSLNRLWSKGRRTIKGYVSSITDGTTAVAGQLEVVKKLQEQYEKLGDEIKRIQAEVEVERLLQGIPEDQRALFEPLADAAAGYNKELLVAAATVKRIGNATKNLIRLNEEARDKANLLPVTLGVRTGAIPSGQFGGGATQTFIVQNQERKKLLDDILVREKEILGNVFKEKEARTALLELMEQRFKKADELIKQEEQRRELGKQEVVDAERKLKTAKINAAAITGRADGAVKVLEAEVALLDAQIKASEAAEAGAVDAAVKLFKESERAKAGLFDAAREDFGSAVNDWEAFVDHFNDLDFDAAAEALKGVRLELAGTGELLPPDTITKFVENLRSSQAGVLDAHIQDQKDLDVQRELKARDLANAQAEANNEVVGSIVSGAQNFVDGVETLGETLAEVTGDLLEGIGDIGGDLVEGAIRGEDVDVGQAAGELLLSAVRQMVVNLINNITSMFLVNSLLIASNEELVVALQANTAAKAFGNAGGRVSHRGIGFARGGDVASHNFPRPKNIHPSDTVRAWLTPGEHVMTRSASKMFGHGFFDQINAMAGRNKAMISRFVASRQLSPVLGLAGGGSVSASSGANLATRRGSERASGVVLPVLVVDDALGEQIYSGSKDAFAAQSNQNVAIGDVNKSGF